MLALLGFTISGLTGRRAMRSLVKGLAYHMPILRGILNERDYLRKKLRSEKEGAEKLRVTLQNVQRDTLALDHEMAKLRDPKNAEGYKYAVAPLFQIGQADIIASQKHKRAPKAGIKTATWFVPHFENISFGGLYTIFRVVEKLSREGIKNHIVIYGEGRKDLEGIRQQIAKNFPRAVFELGWYELGETSASDLPRSDIAFCTHWVSAYILLRYNQTSKKYYFIQDYEPIFYPAGTIGALAESTYRFGFSAIVNTPGLERAILKKHTMTSTSFMPSVDKSVYYPKKKDVATKEPIKIFFYARPGKERNGFYLGIETIRTLKERYGDRVEIITAGADWKEDRYGLRGMIKNIGLLTDIREVAELYRDCDICFSFMFTKHPSYQPLEFMASQVCYVSNTNEDNQWLLKDQKNCLLSEPSPRAMADTIAVVIDNVKKREEIAAAGYETVSKLKTWDTVLEEIWGAISA